jgi:hypothetical protein
VARITPQREMSAMDSLVPSSDSLAERHLLT